MVFLYNELLFLIQSFLMGSITLFMIWFGRDASSSLTAVLVVLANVFVRKQITLLGLNATASDVLAIGLAFNLNLLQEYYGKQAARRSIIISFFCAVIYAILSQVHLWYRASMFDVMQEHYVHLLGATPRIIAASIISFTASGLIDYWLFGFFKKLCGSRFLIIRNYGSISIAQAVDTVLFSFLGLYGLMTNLGQIMLVSYTVKLMAIALTGPFSWLSRKIIPIAQNS
jgi:queuosine precursor transporter